MTKLARNDPHGNTTHGESRSVCVPEYMDQRGRRMSVDACYIERLAQFLKRSPCLTPGQIWPGFLFGAYHPIAVDPGRSLFYHRRNGASQGTKLWITTTSERIREK